LQSRNSPASGKPSEKFITAARKIIAVPKPELIRREAEYKRARRAKLSESKGRETS